MLWAGAGAPALLAQGCTPKSMKSAVRNRTPSQAQLAQQNLHWERKQALSTVRCWHPSPLYRWLSWTAREKPNGWHLLLRSAISHTRVIVSERSLAWSWSAAVLSLLSSENCLTYSLAWVMFRPGTWLHGCGGVKHRKIPDPYGWFRWRPMTVIDLSLQPTYSKVKNFPCTSMVWYTLVHKLHGMTPWPFRRHAEMSRINS